MNREITSTSQGTPVRHLTLADLAILIAGVAGALVLYKMVRQEEASNPSLHITIGHLIHSRMLPFLILGSASLLIARLIGPRPRLRRVMCQPGTIASVMFLFSFLLKIVLTLVQYYLRDQLSITMPAFLREIRILLLSGGGGGGEILAASWVTLVISGRWRPEPSWIDRSGRVFGVVVILGAIVIRLIP